MFTVQQIQDLQAIMDSDPTIELIEIWGKVLYVRRSVGRCTFMSKPQSLKEELDKIYINLKKGISYVQALIRKFHPDRSKSKCASQITTALLQWRKFISEHIYGAGHSENIFSVVSELPRDFAVDLFKTRIYYGEWPEDGLCNQHAIFIKSKEQREEEALRHAEIQQKLDRAFGINQEVAHNDRKRKKRPVRV